ncbi:MAG: hypothetical protein AB8B65_09800 [Kordia sp.]|uniref:hypothetical protein n=1 Tax=Kordia sp. TaxID=1965332 RepID=UPI00385BA45B
MKKYIYILFLLCCLQFSNGQSQKEKDTEIEFFKFEIKQLNDSTTYYFDLGVKLLKEGEDSVIIEKLIKPKLKKYETEINTKIYSFKGIIEKFKLTRSESIVIYQQLKDIFKSNSEKYDYLIENDVNIK